MANHPNRFAPKDYCGRKSYFVTVCAHGNEPLFADAAAARLVIDQLFRSASKHGFSITAYCVMPDHVHAVVSANRDDCDFIKWINLWRQLSGYEFKRRTGRSLWQEGYWDRTLPSDEEVVLAVAYTVANPVRKGWVKEASDYPHSGSQTYSMQDLSALVRLFSDG